MIMTRSTSQLIFCLFLEQFEDFLPTYNATGEIEVRQNTLPRLVDWLFPAFRSIAGNIGSMQFILNNNINVGVSCCGVRFCWGYIVDNG